MSLIIAEKLSELRDLSDGNDDLICLLLDKFLVNAEKYLDTAKESLASKKYEDVKFAIHTMKGSSMSLGLKDLGDILTILNQKCKDDDYSGFEESIEQMYQMIESVREYRGTF
ncbi:MAG: Hpt domain-containing protein [Leptospirales bacterium]